MGLKNRIRGWIPKEPIRLSAQTIRTLSVFLRVIIAVLIVPNFYLVIQATNYLGILWPIIYLVIIWFHCMLSIKQVLKRPFPQSRKQ